MTPNGRLIARNAYIHTSYGWLIARNAQDLKTSICRTGLWWQGSVFLCNAKLVTAYAYIKYLTERFT